MLEIKEDGLMFAYAIVDEWDMTKDLVAERLVRMDANLIDFSAESGGIGYPFETHKCTDEDFA